jgi:hypothetical protein
LRPSPVRTAPALSKARPLSRPRARLEWLGTASRTRGCTDRLPEKLLGAAGDWEGPDLYRWFQGGNYRHLWEEQAARGAVGPVPDCTRGRLIKLRLRRGAGAREVCAYEQSRNVLSFHGHNARDSTSYQGFRLRTGGGGWGSRSGCNDLAKGYREAGAGGVMKGEDLLGTPPRGEQAGTVAGAGRASAPTRPALGSLSHFPGLRLSPHFAYQQRQDGRRKSRKTPSPGFYVPHERVRYRRCFPSVYIRSEPSQERRRPVSSQTSMSRTRIDTVCCPKGRAVVS